MCVTATAKRRRRQAKNNFNHISGREKPIYKKRSAESSAARMASMIERQRRIAANKGKKK